MSNDTPNVGVLDPIAEFARLKLETDEITAKIRATAPLLNPSLNTSNNLLGMVLSELKMMRKEMNEMKEDVSSIKLKQQNQEELLNELKENVSSSFEEMKIDVGVIKLEQQNQKEVLDSQSKNLEEIKEKQTNFLTNISSLKCHPTIRDHIFGKWRNVENHDSLFCAMVKDNTLMIKWGIQDSYYKNTLGVKQENGIASYVENNKIVLRVLSAEGEETVRLEYSFENGVLKREHFKPGQEGSICRYERIGDPDPE